MADKNFKARIVNKNGTSAEWEKATSFVPKKGELILYTDLNKIKIGDGVTKVNDLPFLTVPNKTSDLTNDSGYITNTSVDTKLKDKVSKAGDTMTGMLGVNFSAYPGSGGIVFGMDPPSDVLTAEPGIFGVKDDHSVTLVAKKAIFGHASGNMLITHAEFNETENLIQNSLTFRNSEQFKKGTVSVTNDGLGMSAEDGACLKVGAKAVTVCDNAGGAVQIKGVKAPVNDTDAANKKYVDDSIPTAQIEELSSAVAKAEPFFVEVTMTNPSNISANKTFAEIKTASDAGKLCYARITNSGIMMPLIAFDLRVDKRVAVFSSSNLLISTFQTISLLIAEDNSVSTETFSSQSLIEATGLLKGSGNGTITAAVAGTDYAAVDHTHDTYTATEIDAMWNAVTIN